MQAVDFYNEKLESSNQHRDPMRNTHNFIKAMLIQSCLPTNADLLDIGCGQGGDLLKFKRSRPRSYRGIDASSTAIHRIGERIRQIGWRAPYVLECIDMTRDEWSTTPLVNAVSCQFSLHHLFVSEAAARHAISRMASSLVVGGVLFGTIPVHNAPAYSKVRVKLPDDNRLCEEPSAPRDVVQAICESHGLRLREWIGFEEYYAKILKSNGGLAKKMNAATTAPDSRYAVFIFDRVPTQKKKQSKSSAAT